MSYQAIARKYRPQTFGDMSGQEHITRTLSHALDDRRLHHAYLFSGVRGTGKTTMARILAKGLNCRLGITSRPCLQCASCLEIAAGNSLDVHEIDAASNTGVDNVRDVIINNIAMAPARDRHKIFVIDEVHMLSTSAFNALLKTLEEPPAHVIFIMATTELHKVPDTILSRCQQFEFRQIPTEKIYRRLRDIADLEAVKIGDAALREIARAGAGSLRDAQSAFDQVIAFSGHEITEEDVAVSLGLVSAATLGRLIEAVASRDTLSIVSLVDEVSSRGYDLRNLTRELMAYLRHLLVVKSGIVGGDALGVADIEIERIKQLSSRFSEADLVRCFHLLAETEKEIKDSPYPRFQLEIGLVKLAHATRLRSLDDLIKRLEELEGKLSGGEPNAGNHQPSTAGRSPMATTEPSPKTATAPKEPPASAHRRDSTLSEPPDFPDFDQTEPLDLIEPDQPWSARPKRPAQIAKAPAETAPVSVPAGHEVDAILLELQRLNRGLVLTALEDAQNLKYQDGVLTASFGTEDMFAKRVRESGVLFRSLGEKLFGQPLRVEVKISGQTEEHVDEEQVKRHKLREQAMSSKAVRLILQETRGEIVWVKENPQETH